jgi:rubredoxin
MKCPNCGYEDVRPVPPNASDAHAGPRYQCVYCHLIFDYIGYLDLLTVVTYC